MARPLRVVVAVGWYHVAARGTDRRTIFGDAREHAHFIELLAAMVERYGIRRHAYLHLNPGRVRALGLGKEERAAERRGLLPPPTPEMRRAWLAALRGHRWSSYPAYAGYARVPSWLTCEELWRRAGGETGDGRRAYRVAPPRSAKRSGGSTAGSGRSPRSGRHSPGWKRDC